MLYLRGHQCHRFPQKYNKLKQMSYKGQPTNDDSCNTLKDRFSISGETIVPECDMDGGVQQQTDGEKRTQPKETTTHSNRYIH